MKRLSIKSIEGDKVLLKPFSLKFVNDNYLAWMNDKEVTKFIYKAKDHISLNDLTLFANKMVKSDYDYFFAILIKKTQLHVGNVRLGPVDFNLMISKFGIMIGDKNLHNQGIGTEVMELIKEFSFNYLNLRQISFPVVKEHSQAMKLYSKTKFKCLGNLKETFNKNGKSWELVEWSMRNPKLINSK